MQLFVAYRFDSNDLGEVETSNMGIFSTRDAALERVRHAIEKLTGKVVNLDDYLVDEPSYGDWGVNLSTLRPLVEEVALEDCDNFVEYDVREYTLDRAVI